MIHKVFNNWLVFKIISSCERSENITTSYVGNGLLLTEGLLCKLYLGSHGGFKAFPHSSPHIHSGKIILQHRKRDELLSTINPLLKVHPGPSIMLVRHLGSRWVRPIPCPQTHFLSTVTSCPQTYFLSTKLLPVHKLTFCPPASWLKREVRKMKIAVAMGTRQVPAGNSGYQVRESLWQRGHLKTGICTEWAVRGGGGSLQRRWEASWLLENMCKSDAHGKQWGPQKQRGLVGDPVSNDNNSRSHCNWREWF